MVLRRLLPLTVVFSLLPLDGWAQTAQDIVRQSRERGALNLVGLSAELQLTTVDAGGATKVQVLSSSARKVNGRGASITRFSAPPEVAGVAVLTLQGEGTQPDEISIYLPKLHRVRKVAPSQRSESFMRTDFSYADLGSTGGTHDEAFTRLADAAIDGRPVFVVRAQAPESSPYGTVTLSVDQQTFVPLRVDYSDKAGKPLKVYRSLSLKRFRDRVVSAKSVMENLQTHTRTELDVLSLAQSTLGDDAFTERALERG